VGLGVAVTNLFLGGVLMAAAPALAWYVHGKVEIETKKRAKEFAPQALREAAEKIGPKLDEMIQDFAGRLDAWVVTAGEELHREVIEVLTATRAERAASAPGTDAAIKACDHQVEVLGGLHGKLEGMRSALWTPENGEPKDVPPPATPTVPNAPGGSA
jgi:hypothetical protein